VSSDVAIVTTIRPEDEDNMILKDVPMNDQGQGRVITIPLAGVNDEQVCVWRPSLQINNKATIKHARSIFIMFLFYAFIMNNKVLLYCNGDVVRCYLPIKYTST